MPRWLCALTAGLGIWIFLKTRVPLHLQVRGQAEEMQGFCALDLRPKAHLLPFMSSEVLSELAELALWEEENVLPTSALK